LAVDNMTSREPLRPEALQALKVFAEHAALAVRNSQLIQSREKEAQLRGVTLTAITVAHQINNALVGVVSGAELLERGAAQLDPKQAKLVRNIAQSGRQIAEFVKKLSNVTRLTTVKYLGNLEMLDLGSASNGEDGGASTTQPEEKGNGNANQQNKEL
jgi:K+-sensing histidine kinase KdpD